MTDTLSPPASTGRSSARRPKLSPGRLRHTAKDWLDRPMTSWHLILAIFVLMLGFGLIMVLSASSIISYRTGDGVFAGIKSQGLFAAVGLIVFVLAARVPPRLLRTMGIWAVLVSMVLLVAVLVFGERKWGATSWLQLGPIRFQPSEVAKLALVIWMSHVLASRRHTLRSLRQLLFPVLPMFGIMVALIMKQPDLGTSVSLSIVFFAVMWFAGAPGWMFIGLGVAGIGGIVYLATSAGYRNTRIQAWLDPNNPALAEATYQLHQGLYGLGNGGIFGVGLGQSRAKWNWLPNADSDFIFAIIGEELGLVGAGLVLVLFGMLAYTGMRIARRNVDPFIKIVSASCTVWLVGQAAINIGYVIGLLPVTGITLPMFSTGGTSLLVTMAVFGLLANFARREPQAAAALYAQGPGRLARFLGVGMKAPGATTGSEWDRRRKARKEAAAAKRAERTRRDRAAAQARQADRRKPPAGGARRAAEAGRAAAPGHGEPRRKEDRGAGPRTVRQATGRGGGAAAAGRRSVAEPDRPRPRRGEPDRRAGAPRRTPRTGR